MYKKQELISAFCEARNCQPSDLVKIQSDIENILTQERNLIQQQIDLLQARLAKLPTTAKERMKRIALDHLNKKQAEQTLLENKDVII